MMWASPYSMPMACPSYSHWFIENTRYESFDIKFTRQGFENAC